MRELLKQSLAVLLAVAVVSAGGLGAVTYTDQNVSPVGEAEAVGDCHMEDSLVVSITNTAGLTNSEYGCNLFADPKEKELQQADAYETKVELYQSGATDGSNSDLLMDSMSNYLEDTRSIALMEGKAAYIRALENGSVESVAKSEARQAVADYYAVKQKQLITKWNQSNAHWQHLRDVAANTTNVTASYVDFGWNGSHTNMDDARYHEHRDGSVTLVNQSSVPTVEFGIDAHNDGTSASGDWGFYSYWNPAGFAGGDDSSHAELETMYVHPPDDSYTSAATLLNYTEFRNKWDTIVAQNDAVQDEVTQFANSTYDQWESGDINSSDLVDPYLGARDYSPDGDDAQTWALQSLQALGIDGPKNLSGYAHMTVRVLDTNETHDGILMSDGVPQGGAFEVGTTYNTSNLTGPQYVVTESDQIAIDGEFQIEALYDTDGTETNQTSIDYRQVDYTTTDLTEYQQLLDELAATAAEIEARQQELREQSGGGGGLLSGIGLGGGSGLVAVLVVGGVVLLMMQSGGNGGTTIVRQRRRK